MDSRESKDRAKSDRVASSQFLMIVIVFALALVVQQSDVATSRP
ncbi:MAG TPA: hypothetical protein VFO25_12950 [Candidatus Eremiobacteraceae bacterium]|nr:hypothetical protein [Candidatus Eremiobacteraceae bacterium]